MSITLRYSTVNTQSTILRLETIVNYIVNPLPVFFKVGYARTYCNVPFSANPKMRMDEQIIILSYFFFIILWRTCRVPCYLNHHLSYWYCMIQQNNMTCIFWNIIIIIFARINIADVINLFSTCLDLQMSII